MNCLDCNHPEHEPGKCEHDNCGQSEICHSDALDTDRTKVVTYANYQSGGVSTTTVTHVKPRKVRV